MAITKRNQPAKPTRATLLDMVRENDKREIAQADEQQEAEKPQPGRIVAEMDS